MMKNIGKKSAVFLLACALGFLCACGDGQGEQPSGEVTASPGTGQPTLQPTQTPSQEPSQEPDDGPVNPLTGLPVESEEEVARRPVAIMLNNLAAALPQQGNGGADVIYEVVAEGGITRMLAVYQSLEGVDIIGSVRSARPYYIELALGHDAIFIHAGGSEDAYADMTDWKVDHLDGVRGTYSAASAGLFWRDRDRVDGHHYDLEHSLVTSGEAVRTVLEKSGLRLEHESGYAASQTFVEDGTPAGGEDAGVITVPFSNYKTGMFRYDRESGLYLVEQRGEPYIDGNTGEQIAVTNVLVLRAPVQNSGDSYGHMNVELSGGDGWFACGGKLIPITWSKSGRDGALTFKTGDGGVLELGKGKSYVNIISLSKEISWE